MLLFNTVAGKRLALLAPKSCMRFLNRVADHSEAKADMIKLLYKLCLVCVSVAALTSCRPARVLPATPTPDPHWPVLDQPGLDLVLVGPDDLRLVDLSSGQTWPMSNLLSNDFEDPMVYGTPWSPNGYQLIFQTRSPKARPGPIVRYIHLVDLQTRTTRVLYQGLGVSDPEVFYWSHDGRYIAFTETTSRQAGQGDNLVHEDRLQVLDIATDKMRTVYKEPAMAVIGYTNLAPFGWSRDDHILGLFSTERDLYDLILVDMATSQITWKTENEGIYWAQWSSASNDLCVSSSPYNNIANSGVAGPPEVLSTVDPDTLQPLMSRKGLFISAAWAPGGSRVAYWTSTGVCVMDWATGQEACPIVALPTDEEMAGENSPITWSKDGQRLAFSVLDKSSGNYTGYIVDLWIHRRSIRPCAASPRRVKAS
jgi:hypothetical protein